MGHVLIGAVAEAAGVSTQAIRFYERRGLLRRPERLENGYRHYDLTTVDRIGFIQSAQASGLSLADIGGILAMRDADQSPCEHVADLLANKLADVRDRQRQLEQLAGELEALLDQSADLSPTECTDADICRIISRGAAARS